jgi:hypothetical protein
MINNEQLQAAVILADGWSAGEYVVIAPYGFMFGVDKFCSIGVNALAAQLVSQIDEMENYAINVNEFGASVTFTDDAGCGVLGTSQGRDKGRSVNAILAILDAGVA